ncbi:hypothetical protein [Campylobacter sp. LR185c]|uniref:hypothetical protein n=1 Tax=Campylobacter sp. LR185c TaxID=2014525 RepID=UPI00168108CF|nr:hypothetical protein [Campylobacter sp. LR185c]
MKKIILILMLSSILLYAKSQKLSKIEPSENIYPNLSTHVCNKNCLLEYLESRLYLSFLSEFSSNTDQLLVNIYAKLLNSITDFEKNIQKSASIKLAVIIPEKTIKSYSNTIINASVAYLLRQRADIKLKVFLIGTEDSVNIKEALQQIKAQNYQYIVAGLTQKGVSVLENYQDNMKIFIPTTHKSTTNVKSENIFFGGIDYEAQIKTLLNKGNSKIAIFSENSSLLNSLTSEVKQLNPDTSTYNVSSDKMNFASLLRSQESLNGTTIFFNTSLIKTALISSQLRVYKIYPAVLLSTQINYNPALFSLTQLNDRRNFYIANSINNTDDNLAYLNEIFNQNINYNWVSYATSIGVDYFYTNFLSDNKSLFEESINNSQVIYNIRLMRGLNGNFEETK